LFVYADSLLELLDDKTVYPTAIASLVVEVVPELDNSEADAQAAAPPPVRFEVTKRITSLGRNRQSRKEGDFPAPSVDIDLAIFGQFARAASHLHAYVVHTPASLGRVSKKRGGREERNLRGKKAPAGA
jgi:hypothetical protein